MAQLTTNYGLYKPESTDTYNHLVYDNPNMDTIDGVMKANADHSVDNASCIKSGTVHSVTRSNTSCPVFKFTATGDWITGDTMNVDGTPVSVYLPDGTAPLTGCFVINTEVLAIISGSRVTLMCPVIPDASDIPYDANNSVADMLDKTELWVNPDSTIDFGAQDVDLSSSDYEYLEIYYKYTTGNNMIMSTKILKGYGALLNFGFAAAGGAQTFVRLMTRISDVKFNIGDCQYATGTTKSPTPANNVLVPLKIIGYK